jgi:hypothetical protein
MRNFAAHMARNGVHERSIDTLDVSDGAAAALDVFQPRKLVLREQAQEWEATRIASHSVQTLHIPDIQTLGRIVDHLPPEGGTAVAEHIAIRLRGGWHRRVASYLSRFPALVQLEILALPSRPTASAPGVELTLADYLPRGISIRRLRISGVSGEGLHLHPRDATALEEYRLESLELAHVRTTMDVLHSIALKHQSTTQNLGLISIELHEVDGGGGSPANEHIQRLPTMPCLEKIVIRDSDLDGRVLAVLSLKTPALESLIVSDSPLRNWPGEWRFAGWAAMGPGTASSSVFE